MRAVGIIGGTMIVATLVPDAARRRHLAALLEGAGHRVLGCAHAVELRSAIDRSGFEVLVVDASAGEPPLDALLASLRDLGADLPALALAGRDDERELVLALAQGADDCMPWPPRPAELVARVAALSRRARRGRAVLMRIGRYAFDLERRIVQLDGAVVDLTQKEFDLASHLFRHPGALLPRAELLSRIWGVSAEDATTRTVDTHASRVRRKLRLDASAGWRLVPVYGCGYRLEPVAGG
jgi:two-component system response regulator RegX3